MHNAFATSSTPFQSCDPPFSFYNLVESLMPGDSIRGPIRRFCTLMRKMHAHSFVQETLTLNEELLEEKEMLVQRCGRGVELDATRLTFFCLPKDQLNWDDSDEKLGKFILSYVVVVALRLPNGYQKEYVLEAVVRPPSVVVPMNDITLFAEPVTNYYVHNTCKFNTTLGPANARRCLTIEGSFFAQQNTMTSVCAHAALRTAMNSSPIVEIAKLTNKRINDILKIDLSTLEGLNQRQIETVVCELGYKVHSVNFLANTEIEYDHFLYPSLESGCPTILGIQGWDNKQGHMTSHVVTVLGHTLNSDRWNPEASCGYGNYPIQPYIPSANWCDHYIISDDNFGMFSTLPSEMLRNFIVPTKNPNLHATMAISIRPKGVTMPGYFAEQRAIVVAKHLIEAANRVESVNVWLKRMCDKVTVSGHTELVCRTDLVCRTLLRTRAQYRSFLQEQEISVTPHQQEYLERLPDFLWVSEITLPNLYTGNKHKLGDVVIRADATPEDHASGRSLALAWFPGFVQLGPDPLVEAWDVDGHIPLIRNTGSPPALEW